jgi:hypothetical protein
MFLASKGPHGADVHELITWKEEGAAGARRFTVTFATLTDPLTTGWVTNTLQEQAGSSDVSLTYEMQWAYNAGAPAEHRSAPLFPDATAVMRGETTPVLVAEPPPVVVAEPRDALAHTTNADFLDVD